MTDSHSPWTSSSPSFFYAELEDVLPNTIFVAFAAVAAAPLVATPTEAHRVRRGGSRKDPLDSSLDFGKEGGGTPQRRRRPRYTFPPPPFSFHFRPP